MTYEQFDLILADLSINAPTHEIAELALQLQVEIERLDTNQFDDFLETFNQGD